MSVTAAVTAWLRRHLPRRETLHHFRLLRPFAHHLSRSDLWRLHRYSVPRGVALGLLVGIIFPFAHTVIAALLAVPVRANVALAAATTLVMNPLTIPPVYFAAYKLGRWLLRHDAIGPAPVVTHQASTQIGRWLAWLLQASAPTALGLVILSVIAAVIGYGVAAVGWRLWIGRKWRRRPGGLRPGGQ